MCSPELPGGQGVQGSMVCGVQVMPVPPVVGSGSSPVSVVAAVVVVPVVVSSPVLFVPPVRPMALKLHATSMEAPA